MKIFSFNSIISLKKKKKKFETWTKYWSNYYCNCALILELSGAMQIVNMLKLLIDPENMLSAANVSFVYNWNVFWKKNSTKIKYSTFLILKSKYSTLTKRRRKSPNFWPISTRRACACFWRRLWPTHTTAKSIEVSWFKPTYFHLYLYHQ